jgi:hypothetical protein
VGARPVAVAYASATPGTTVTGPTITNASPQYASGGSLLLVQGSGLTVRGTTAATHVHGVNGGSAATLASPAGLQAGDLVAVYVDTVNVPMTPPDGWFQQRQDGQGTIWTRPVASLPTDLGTWSTSDSHGWTYTSIAFGATGGDASVAAVGGGGAQSTNVVFTGSATAP